MKRVKKTKNQRIWEAFNALEKALKVDEPHIQIDLQWGVDPEDPRGKEFVQAIKTFVEAYAKFYGVDKKKIDLNLML